MSSILLPLVQDESTISTPLLGHAYVYVNKDNKVCIKSDSGSTQVLDFSAVGIVDHISVPLNSTTVRTPIKSGSTVLVTELPVFQDIQSLVELPITFRVVNSSSGEYFDTTFYGNGRQVGNKNISSSRIATKPLGYNTLPVTATNQESVNLAIDDKLTELARKIGSASSPTSLSLTFDSATTTINLVGSDSEVISSISLLPLLSKIDIRYDKTTKSLQIYDKKGNKLDEDIPLTDIISGVVTGANWDRRSKGNLVFVSSSGESLFSVSHSIENIEGLGEKFSEVTSEVENVKSNVSALSSTLMELKNNVQGLSGSVDGLRGLQLSFNPATKSLELKDSSSTLITSVSMQSLDDEGTDLKYNSETKEIELYNGQGIKLDSISVSDFVSGMATEIEVNGTRINLKDSSGITISSTTIKVENIEGLEVKLNTKLGAPVVPAGSIPKWTGFAFESSNITDTDTGISLTGGIKLASTPAYNTNDSFTGIYLRENELVYKKNPHLSYSLTGLGYNRRIDLIKNGYSFDIREEDQKVKNFDLILDIFTPTTFGHSLKHMIRESSDISPIKGLYPHMLGEGALFKFKSKVKEDSKHFGTYGMFLGSDGRIHTRSQSTRTYSAETLPTVATQNGDTYDNWNTVLMYDPDLGVYVGDNVITSDVALPPYLALHYKNDVQKGVILSPKMSQAMLSEFSTKINGDQRLNGMVVYNKDIQAYLQFKNGNWVPLGSDNNIYSVDGTVSSDRVVSMNGSLEFKTNGNKFKISGLKQVTSGDDLTKFSAVVRQDPETKELAIGSAVEITLTHPDTIHVETGIQNVNINVTNSVVTTTVPVHPAEYKQYKKIMKKYLTYNFTQIENFTYTPIDPTYTENFIFETVDHALYGKTAIINEKITPAKPQVMSTAGNIISMLQIGGEYQVQDGMLFKFTIHNFNNRYHYDDFVVENETGDRTTLFTLGSNNQYATNYITPSGIFNNRFDASPEVQIIMYYYNKKFFITCVYAGGISHKHWVQPVENLTTKFKLKFMIKTYDYSNYLSVIGISGKYTVIPSSDLTIIDSNIDYTERLHDLNDKTRFTQMTKTDFDIIKEYPSAPNQIILTPSGVSLVPNLNPSGVPVQSLFETLKSKIEFPGDKDWVLSYTLNTILINGIPFWRMGLGTGNAPTLGVLQSFTSSTGFFYLNGTQFAYNVVNSTVNVTYKKVANLLLVTFTTPNATIGNTKEYLIPDHLLTADNKFKFIFNTETKLPQFNLTYPEYFIKP